MRNKTVLIALMVVLAILATVVWAQSRRPATTPGTDGKGDWGMRIARELGLTQAQMNSLKTLREQFMTATQADRDQLRAGMKEIADMWATGASAADLQAKADQLQTLHRQLANTAIDYAVRARAVLTPEQLTKLRTMIDKNPHLGMGLLGPMGGPGMGGGHGRGPGCGMHHGGTQGTH